MNHPGIGTYLTQNGGKRYQVRWKSGGRRKSRSFHRLEDAKRFRLQKQVEAETRGLQPPADETPTLGEFVNSDWLPGLDANVSKGRLTRQTADLYRKTYFNHVMEGLGELRLGSLAIDDLVAWQEALEKEGIGAPTQLKAIGVVSSILKAAARKSRKTGVKDNPARLLERPRAKRAKEPFIFSPFELEKLRFELLVHSERKDPLDALRDATLVSLLYMAGLRPGEALALRVSSVGSELLIDSRVQPDGSIVSIPKNQKKRTVPIRPALRRDLDYLISTTGLRGSDLLFPRDEKGNPWTSTTSHNWRNRHLYPAQERTRISRLTKVRPYDFGRHSHSALMLASGMSLTRLAEIQGHSIRILAERYAKTINQYADRPAIDPDLEIKKARQRAFGLRDPSSGR